MKETITVNEFYDQVKNNGTCNQVLLQMASKDIFEERKIQQDVRQRTLKMLRKSKTAYGTAFMNLGSKTDWAKMPTEQIRNMLLREHAVKAAEKELTDPENYKTFAENYMKQQLKSSRLTEDKGRKFSKS